MAIINLTTANMMEGALLEPQWYDLSVREMRIKTAASGNSTNYFVEFDVLSHPDKPVVKKIINDSLGMKEVVALVAAIQGKTVGDLLEEAKKNNGALSIDSDDLEGKKLKGRLTHTKDRDDKLQNDFSEYLPFGSEAVL